MTDLPNDPTAPSDQPQGSSTESERERHQDVLDSDPTANDGEPGPVAPPAATAPLPAPPHPYAPSPTAQIPGQPGPELPWQGQSGQQGQFGQPGQQGQFAQPGQSGQFGAPDQFRPQGQSGGFGPQGPQTQFGQQAFGGGQQPWQGQSASRYGVPGGPGGPRPGGPGGPGGPIGPGQGGFKWWWAAIPAAIVLILVAVFGIKVIAPRADGPTPRTQSSTTAQPSLPTRSTVPTRPTRPTTPSPTPSTLTTSGPPASAVTPSPGQAVPVKDPKKVRLEVLSATKGKADVRFGADNKDTKRLDDQQTPFAVEAPLSPQNNFLSVGASDYDTKALLMCRVYLDDVLVHQKVASGSVSCALSRNLVSETRADPGGAPLAPASPVTPQPGEVPALPANPTKTTYELYSSVDGGTVDLRYGADRSLTVANDQKTPLGLEAALQTGADFLSYRASGNGNPSPYLMCRLYIDGVLVNQQQGYRSVSCNTSLSTLYDR